MIAYTQDEKHGLERVANKIFNFANETSENSIKDMSAEKDLLTKSPGSKYTEMYTTKQATLVRAPRHAFTCNQIHPMPVNDDVKSILDRMGN